MKHTIYWVLILLCISCGDDNKPEQAYISLDQTEIAFDDSDSSHKIQLKVKANSIWQINNIPDWISLDRIKGNTSTEITITVNSNKNIEPREAKIIFTCDDKSVILSISQAKGVKELAWSPLAFFSFDNDVSFVYGKNNIERIYNFTTRQLFINPSVNPNIEEKIFLGNLVNRHLERNTDIAVYNGYTFNPITVFSLLGTEKSQTFIPSKSAQDAFANLIISKKPTQSEVFRSDGIGVIYNSHRELNLIGVGNMGVNLDEVISEKSYQEQEMTRSNGIIYSFSHTLFTLSMDLQEHIAKEEINKNDFPDNSISYISSVSYGRIGLLIVESDYDITRIKSVINKILQTKPETLTLEDMTILNELNAYHLYYDKSQRVKITKGNIEAIEAYKNQITGDIYNVFPFKFTISDYFEHGDSSMGFSITLP